MFSSTTILTSPCLGFPWNIGGALNVTSLVRNGPSLGNCPFVIGIFELVANVTRVAHVKDSRPGFVCRITALVVARRVALFGNSLRARRRFFLVLGRDVHGPSSSNRTGASFPTSAGASNFGGTGVHATAGPNVPSLFRTPGLCMCSRSRNLDDLSS